MNGTPIVATTRTSTAEAMADIDRLSRFRDSLVGPISVVYVVLQVLAALVAMWAIRRNRRWATPALVMASTVVLVPPLAFLSGAVRYDRLPEVVYVVGLFALAAVVSVALVVVGRRRGWPIWAPVLALVGLALAVQWIDITTGGPCRSTRPSGTRRSSPGVSRASATSRSRCVDRRHHRGQRRPAAAARDSTASRSPCGPPRSGA